MGLQFFPKLEPHHLWLVICGAPVFVYFLILGTVVAPLTLLLRGQKPWIPSWASLVRRVRGQPPLRERCPKCKRRLSKNHGVRCPSCGFVVSRKIRCERYSCWFSLFMALVCYVALVFYSYPLLFVLFVYLGFHVSPVLLIGPVIMIFPSAAVYRYLAFEYREVDDAELAKLEEPRCDDCGYDLTGNTSGRCPECGFRVAVRKSSN